MIKTMEDPDPIKDIDLGPIAWNKDPKNELIKTMLVNKGV